MRALTMIAVASLAACVEQTGGPEPTVLTGAVEDAARPREVDVLVAGAGAGGIAAALQASRMGMRVALLEPTRHVGGQLLTVTSMDETGGATRVHPRTEGIYGELARRITERYSPRPVGTCYWSDITLCYEAAEGQSELREMIAERQAQGLPDLILALETEVTGVEREDPLLPAGRFKVTTSNGGAWLARVVIDATEYGDLLPLAGAAYRVGNGAWDPETGELPRRDACVQNITYTLTLRHYDGGIPTELDLRPWGAPGADYAERRRSWLGIVPDGAPVCEGCWSWNHHNGYRGTPDRSNPDHYTGLDGGFTKTMVNALNDYPTIWSLPDAGYSVAAVEDRAVRRREECLARWLTLQFLYYAQAELGVSWAASDEVSAYGLADHCDDLLIPPQYRGTERLFPAVPYVREGRRVIGVTSLTAKDTKRVPSSINAEFSHVAQRSFPTSIALGHYVTDLHGCNGPATLDLGDTPDDASGASGPFQIPFGALIPRSVDGLLVAEKNLSTSRLANGATRLQPVSMLTGQAAGTIAALAVRRGVEPRWVPPVLVQRKLLETGSSLSLHDFSDVPSTHRFWRDVQLASTHGILAGYGGAVFGVGDGLTRAQAAIVLQRVFRYPLPAPKEPPSFSDVPEGHWAHRYVEAMAERHMTSGCGGGQYCPDAHTTRAQMAAFLVAGLGVTTTACLARPFPDVPTEHPACPAIQALGQLGLAVPCLGGGFCPDQRLERGEAAAFAGNLIEHLSANPAAVGSCWRSPPDYCEGQ